MDHSPFGKLPAELRDLILEAAVVFDAPITMRDKSSLIDLPITQTCSELRRRSLALFYERNIFHLEIVDCDASFMAEWRSHYIEDYALKHEHNAVKILGEGDWAKALTWLELSFADQNIQLAALKDDSKYRNLSVILARAFSISKRLKAAGMTWLDAKPVIEDALSLSKDAIHWRNAPVGLYRWW